MKKVAELRDNPCRSSRHYKMDEQQLSRFPEFDHSGSRPLDKPDENSAKMVLNLSPSLQSAGTEIWQWLQYEYQYKSRITLPLTHKRRSPLHSLGLVTATCYIQVLLSKQLSCNCVAMWLHFTLLSGCARSSGWNIVFATKLGPDPVLWFFCLKNYQKLCLFDPEP